MISDEPLYKYQDNTTTENHKVAIHVFYPNLNEILVERNNFSKDLRNEDPQNKEATVYSKTNEEDNEGDDNPIANHINKIFEEKATLEPTLNFLKSLAKSIIDKAKRKKQKADTSKHIVKIVKLTNPRTSPLKGKKESPSKSDLVKKNTPRRSPMSKRRKVKNEIEKKKPFKRKLI